jgi:hypothetical protein
MKDISLDNIIQWCDDQILQGRTLTIAWNGGSDEGAFDLKIDDETQYEQSGIIEAIINLVSDELGYGGFDGDFTSEGELTYNMETRSFVGIDTYSESESQTKPCALEIRLSADIWFDRVEIDLDSQDYDETSAMIRLILTNGPYTDAHDEAGVVLGKQLSNQIDELLDDVEDFSGLSYNISIPVTDFISRDGNLVYVLNELTYSYYEYKKTPIDIYLHQN